MALVKICPACRHANRPGAFFCENPDQPCPRSISAVEPTEDMPGAAISPCPFCAFAANPPDAADCLRCGRLLKAAARRFAIRFSFGELPLEPSTRVGRDPEYSPLGGQLADLRKVSRRHAEFTIAGDRLFVRDVRATNGVRVNGERIAPDIPYPVKAGDEISFSSELRGTIVAKD